MFWNNIEPPKHEMLLVKVNLKSGDEYCVCYVDDDGDYVDKYGDCIGFDILADFYWILLDDILSNIEIAVSPLGEGLYKLHIDPETGHVIRLPL